jgi:hydrogenase nickel incorporation protein HypA/HybF
MHEYSIVQALLERVDREVAAHGATRVHAVRVSIGELAGVEIELLQTAYDTIRRGTVCDDAPLDVTRVEAHWECPRCDAAIERGRPLQCAQCGAAARLAAGDEIVLDRIEMEVA